MARTPPHPSAERIRLHAVLDCLGDPVRLSIVRGLAGRDGAPIERRCSDFNPLGSKSLLAYHFAKLRDAGVIRTRLVGTSRLMRLRREDLDQRFPGLLDAIVVAAGREPGLIGSGEAWRPALRSDTGAA